MTDGHMGDSGPDLVGVRRAQKIGPVRVGVGAEVDVSLKCPGAP